ncbi:hypothetical protein Bhyg_12044, partial [Pseudolycoriella hygida]
MRMDELNVFHQQLCASDSAFYDLVAYIKTFLGNDIKKGIKKALNIILSKDVQKQLSW